MLHALTMDAPLSDDDQDAPQEATPHYNNTILSDMMYSRHLARLHARMNESPNMVDAAMLLKVWLYQRTSAKGMQ